MKKLRPEVQRFAEEMEKQLQTLKHKGVWKKCTATFLLKEIQKNYNALGFPVFVAQVHTLPLLYPEDKENILRRATNIANFAMMIADNWGGLIEKEFERMEKK